MKKLVLVLSLLLLHTTAQAKFGAGFVLGSPTALSAKYWFGGDRALDFGLGWDSGDMFFFSDYLFHFPGGLDGLRIPARLIPYVGVGGLLKIYNDSARKVNDNNNNSLRVVARVPLGFEWLVQRAPLGVFLEIVPGIRISPNTSSEFGAGIGLRFYFN